jgi:GH18 family chitinase
MDGVDLDVELGGQALSASVRANLATLITMLRERLPAGKLITMATFSVGADPVGACTVSGSAHCSEDVELLMEVGSKLDYVNIMAYDAGVDYATCRYREALQNYLDLIPNKAILGLSNKQ